MRRQTKKTVDSVLGNNRAFDCQFALLRRRISYNRTKEHMQIINGKQEDNDFVMNSTEQMSKVFSRSRQNKNSVNGDIRTDINHFQQTMLMAMTGTPYVRK